mmetsp:Transcript_14625/g.30007  ORF Transcript_14625/g.30007 Transcript_14625/m.30007 type:complete len:244 (+) Transcript_14625:169-900(+)
MPHILHPPFVLMLQRQRNPHGNLLRPSALQRRAFNLRRKQLPVPSILGRTTMQCTLHRRIPNRELFILHNLCSRLPLHFCFLCQRNLQALDGVGRERPEDEQAHVKPKHRGTDSSPFLHAEIQPPEVHGPLNPHLWVLPAYASAHLGPVLLLLRLFPPLSLPLHCIFKGLLRGISLHKHHLRAGQRGCHIRGPTDGHVLEEDGNDVQEGDEQVISKRRRRALLSNLWLLHGVFADHDYCRQHC